MIGAVPTFPSPASPFRWAVVFACLCSLLLPTLTPTLLHSDPARTAAVASCCEFGSAPASAPCPFGGAACHGLPTRSQSCDTVCRILCGVPTVTPATASARKAAPTTPDAGSPMAAGWSSAARRITTLHAATRLPEPRAPVPRAQLRATLCVRTI